MRATSVPPENTGILAEIRDAIDEFAVTKRLEEGRSENTVNAYKYDLHMFFSFVERIAIETRVPVPTIATIKVAHVKRFLLSLDERQYTKAGIARKIATLKSFFGYCRFVGRIQANPMDQVKSPRISSAEHLPKFLTQEEIERVLEFARQRKWVQEYVLLRFMYATMCRVSEVCGVRIRDLDLDRGTVHVRGKGNKERWVPVDGKTMALIQKLILPYRHVPDEPLFTNKRGAAMRPRVVEALFQRVKEALSFPVDKKMTPHVFRHTGATMLRRNGMDISELQDLLGHASPNTTRIYAKNDIEGLNASYKRMHPLAKE
ncbi:MAG: tyrosine-type recombinase/integrase [Candidatus Lokiarchaeota archaeon]|nr:tyrosine-type recombinase/integrase [Candidatus Lokiarchaeota archaeon]